MDWWIDGLMDWWIEVEDIVYLLFLFVFHVDLH